MKESSYEIMCLTKDDPGYLPFLKLSEFLKFRQILTELWIYTGITVKIQKIDTTTGSSNEIMKKWKVKVSNGEYVFLTKKTD